MLQNNTSEKTAAGMTKFRLHWLGGEKEIVEGYDIADAFRRAGYGGGARNALDWYEDLPASEAGACKSVPAPTTSTD